MSCQTSGPDSAATGFKRRVDGQDPAGSFVLALGSEQVECKWRKIGETAQRYDR